MNRLFDTKELKHLRSYELKVLSAIRVFLFIFLGVLTLGVLWLSAHWFPTIYYLLYRDEDDISKAEYILYTKKSGTRVLEKINRRICKINPVSEVRDYLFTSFEGQLYYYSPSKKCFRSVVNCMRNFIIAHPEMRDQLLVGLSDVDARNLIYFYGKNKLEIDNKSLVRVALEEIFGPVLFTQLLSAVAFYFLGRRLYSFIVVLFVSITAWIRIRGYMRNRETFQRISDVKDFMRTKRKYKKEVFEELLDVRTLTVGDIVEVNINKKFTCDMILVQGNCLVNESMLTGETVPVSKTTYEFNGLDIRPNNLLLSGTFSVHNKTPIVKALIIGTGWNTSKGKLLGGIVFREHVYYRFERDFFLMLAYLFSYNIILAITVIVIELNRESFQYRRVFMRVLEFVKNGFPPSIFFVSVANIQQSSSRLASNNINSLTSEKIIEAGAVKVICFDKTGTLTETELTLQGFLLTSDNGFEPFTNRMEDVFMNPQFTPFIWGIACCHSLNDIEGKVIGDPLDEQMFKFSEASLRLRVNKKNPNQPLTSIQLSQNMTRTLQYKKDKFLTIISSMEFTSERKRISVLVHNENTNEYYIFCKGAPETIETLCKYETLPYNYVELYNEYTQNGLRIISIAYRKINPDEINQNDKLLETNLEFLGLLVFDNPLKPRTAELIKELRVAKHIVTMITGDNIYTGVNISLKSGIVKASQDVYVGSLSTDGNLHWEIFHSGHLFHSTKEALIHSKISSMYSLHQITQAAPRKIAHVLKECEGRNIRIALTGNAFEHLMHLLSNDTKTKDKLLNICSVFGRCTANQKKLIVEEFKDMLKKQDAYVAFVGDGSNDSIALKAANVGLSIGNDESAFSASFFSSVNDISPLREIIIEGKSCLSNALNQFKFIMATALFMNTNYFMLYYKQIDFLQAEFVLLTFYFFPIAYFLGFTKSTNKLTPLTLKPYILHKNYLIEFLSFGFSMIFFFLLNTFIYSNFIVYKKTHDIVDDFEIPGFSFDEHFFITPKYVFFNVLLFVSTSGLTNHKSFPFKKPIYTNVWFVVYMLFALMAAFFVLYFDAINPFGDLFGAFYMDKMRFPNFDPKFRQIFVLLLIFEAFAIYLIDQSMQCNNNMKLFKSVEKDTYMEGSGLEIKSVTAESQPTQ